MISRRRFLVRSAQLAVAGVAARLVWPARGQARVPLDGASDSAWRDLARRLEGPVLRPGEPGYAEIARPQNLRYGSVLPWGIARCESPQDVAQAVLWSREFGVPLAIRGGGHSYAGYSTGRGLMIDLALMNDVRFEPTTGIVTMSGGLRAGVAFRTLQRLGVAFSHGRCPSVGVGGFLLGGGIGFDMRAEGVGSDRLAATELVTADGQVLTAHADDNADLFWACRGGAGANFGINTAFSVRTYPVDTLTVFDIVWRTRPEVVCAAVLDALGAAPPALGSRVRLDMPTPQALAAGEDVTVGVLGQLAGTPAELARILAAAYAVAGPASERIRTMDYWDAQLTFLATSPSPGFFQERSRFFPERPSDQALATAFHWARQWPGTSAGASLILFQTGERVNALAADATAFVHRDSRWLMALSLDWSPADADEVVAHNREWQDAFYEAMLPFAGPGSFQNFPDPSLTDWLDAYYGENLQRLRRIKRAVDPTNVFRYPQSIPPA